MLRLLPVFLLLLLSACTKNEECVGSDCQEFHPIHLRIENVTNQDFTYVEIGGGNQANYPALNAGDTSDYQYRPEGGYRYNYVKVKTAANDSFIIQPFDFVGETPLDEGYYTYRLYYHIVQNDTILRLDFQVD